MHHIRSDLEHMKPNPGLGKGKSIDAFQGPDSFLVFPIAVTAETGQTGMGQPLFSLLVHQELLLWVMESDSVWYLGWWFFSVWKSFCQIGLFGW